MQRTLDSEIAFFDAHVDEIRRGAEEAKKDIVLIHARTVIGYYDSIVDAIEDGYRKFGSDLFLARPVSTAGKTLTLASVFRQ